MPVHLVGAGEDLDVRTTANGRSPHATVQDFLNRYPRYLWGILSNGHLLRVLRDASSLTRQSYVEFDLDDIVINQRYADFRLFFLTVHASRFVPVAEQPGHPPATRTTRRKTPRCCRCRRRPACSSVGEQPPSPTAPEPWRRCGSASPGRCSISAPGSSRIRRTLSCGSGCGRCRNADDALRRALLRVAYRLLVLFVAEDRDVLHPRSTDPAARDRNARYLSAARLRRLAATRAGTAHTDLWAAHLLVTDALAGDGRSEIGVPGLAASLFDRDSLDVLRDAVLPNRALLDAVRALSWITDPVTRVTRPVDFRHLDSEELGGVYEGLLVYHPRYDAPQRTFALEEAAGNERKKSGSYYTPPG